MQASEILPIAALVISLCSLWLSTRNYFRDRHKLRFDGFMICTAGPRDETFQLGVTITNEGRRPISVTEIYFENETVDGEFRVRTPIHGGMFGSFQPVNLTEHQAQQFLSREMTLDESLKLPQTIKLFVEDSAGRSHRIPVRNDAFEFADSSHESA